MSTEQKICTMDDVHPELRSGLNWFIRWLSGIQLTDRTLSFARFIGNLPMWLSRKKSRNYQVLWVPGYCQSNQVKVYVIDERQKHQEKSPAILHLHGGGYVAGNPGLMLENLTKISADLNCLVVSVDYRLAPETKFPGSLEDNYSGLAWLHNSADSLGVDVTRIAVLGESAGGGHAATLALTARDRGEFPICFQALIYPMLDDRSTRPESSSWKNHFGWTTGANYYGWKALLGVEPGSADVPTQAVPARAQNLSGLPPTWIGVGDIDLFYDEDIAYAARLAASGVAVELYTQRGAYHGFDVLVKDATPAKEFTRSWMSALARAFIR